MDPGCRVRPSSRASHPTAAGRHDGKVMLLLDGLWYPGCHLSLRYPGLVLIPVDPDRHDVNQVRLFQSERRGRERVVTRVRSRVVGRGVWWRAGRRGPVRRVRGPGTAGGLAGCPPAGPSLRKSRTHVNLCRS